MPVQTSPLRQRMIEPILADPQSSPASNDCRLLLLSLPKIPSGTRLVGGSRSLGQLRGFRWPSCLSSRAVCQSQKSLLCSNGNFKRPQIG